MNNNHVNHHIVAALAPMIPPNYSVAVKHAHGERGCVLHSADRQSAAINGLQKVALRADEVSAGGVELYVTELLAKVAK